LAPVRQGEVDRRIQESGWKVALMRRLGFGAIALAAACSAEKDATLLVAYVDTDLLVPAELNRIDIRLAPAGGAGTTTTFPLGSAGDAPVTMEIRPSGDPALGVDVTAIGYLGAESFVSQTATVAFTSGEARAFTMVLARDCVQPTACTPETNVCIQGGTCVPSTEVVQTRPYAPTAEGRDTTTAGALASSDDQT
jgi:hypothetical protein